MIDWCRRSSIDATRSRSASMSSRPSAARPIDVRAAELGELAAGGDHRLRRDAVPEVRGAADDVALDQRDVGAERGRDARARVARGPTTEDHDTRHARNATSAARRPGPSAAHVTCSSCPRASCATIALSGRARDRRRRPRGAAAHASRRRPPTQDARPEHCPFCPGHESMTPPEITRTGDGAPGDARAGGCAWSRTSTRSSDAHEVVVLSPDHHRSFGDARRRRRDRGARRCCATACATHLDARATPTRVAHRQPPPGRRARRSRTPTRRSFALDFVPPEVLAAERRAAAAPDDLLDADLARARDHDAVLSRRRGRRRGARTRRRRRISLRVGDTGGGRALRPARPTIELATVALALRDALARLGGDRRRSAVQRRVAHRGCRRHRPAPLVRRDHAAARRSSPASSRPPASS